MAIDSCSSCGSGNLASQYIEQLTERGRLARVPDPDNPDTAKRLPNHGAQLSGPTVNGLGETVGLLVNTTA